MIEEKLSSTRISEPLRFIDNTLGLEVVQLLPGHCYVSAKDEMLSPVLGSCVSICLYDRLLKAGGMNHYLLPVGKEELSGTVDATRYGNHAIAQLIQSLEQLGSRTHSMEAMVFGGGTMFNSEQDVGRRNVEFAWSCLEKHHISIGSHDVGYPFSRKIRFNPVTGKAMIKRLPTLQKIEPGTLDTLAENDASWRLCG